MFEPPIRLYIYPSIKHTLGKSFIANLNWEFNKLTKINYKKSESLGCVIMLYSPEDAERTFRNLERYFPLVSIVSFFLRQMHIFVQIS